MDTIETLLKNLSGGQLQRLALELLPSLHKDWGVLISHGGCEGGYRTRKGTPDIWCEDETGKMVYIQATADSSSGKMFEDTKKSVDKLVKLGKGNSALCVSFLNYEPDSAEVEKCRNYCTPHGFDFLYYTNGQVAKYLKLQHRLCEKYLGTSTPDNFIKLNLDYDFFYEQIDYLTSILKYRLDVKDDLNALLKELSKNAFEHGGATNVEVLYTADKLVISDDGIKFNLIEYNGDPHGGGGGSFTLKHLILKYEEQMHITYKYHNSTMKNKIQFSFDARCPQSRSLSDI